MSIYEPTLGLIWQLDNCIHAEINTLISDKMRSKMSVEQYAEKRSQLYDIVLKEFDFVVYFREHTPRAINNTIKAEIIKRFGKEDSYRWFIAFKQLDVVLVHFWLKGKQYSHEATIINGYHSFIRENMSKLGCLIPTNFREHPNERLDRKLKLKQKLEAEKPTCPNCGSTEINKWSKLRYRCMSCGKTFKRDL